MCVVGIEVKVQKRAKGERKQEGTEVLKKEEITAEEIGEERKQKKVVKF